MPRESRTVLRSLYTPGSERFKDLKSHEARHLYVACLLNADDEGRLEGSPGSLVDMVPWLFRSTNGHQKAKRTAQNWSADLKRMGLIDLYKVGGKEVIQVTGEYEEIQDWQGVKRKLSRLPAPPGKHKSSPPESVDGATLAQKPPVVSKTDRQSVRQTGSKKEENSQSDRQATEKPKRKSEWQTVLKDSQQAYRRITKRDFGQPGKDSGRQEEWINLCGRYADEPEKIISGVRAFAEEQGSNGKKLFNPVSVFLQRAEEYIEAASAAEESEIGEYPDLSKEPCD